MSFRMRMAGRPGHECVSLKLKEGGVCGLSLTPGAGKVSCGDLQASFNTLLDASASMNLAKFSSLVTPVPASVAEQPTMNSSAVGPGVELLEQAARARGATNQASFFMASSEGRRPSHRGISPRGPT